MRERILRGIGASPGIVIGKLFLVEREADLFIPLRKVDKERAKKEIEVYRYALDKTRKELLSAKERLLKSLGKQHAMLVDVYVGIIDDPLLTRDVIRIIEEEMVSAEYALSVGLNRVIQSFEKIEDEYFRGRISDIRDVGRRLLRNILGKDRKSLADIEANSIVVAHTLSPSDTVVLKEKKCAGFVVEIGSKTSHIALVAQGLQLPAVVGLRNITEEVEDGQTIILDGTEGVVIINPEEKTIEEYAKRYHETVKEKEYLIKLKDLPAQTVDGHKVKIVCNVDTYKEVDDILNSGAEGVGLFRTEFMYIDKDELPTENELFEKYYYVAEKINPYSVVFRTIDLGGDKLSKFGLEGLLPEPSPALGLRGIRLALRYRDIFKTQIRAILRASVFKNVKMMFPLISGVSEFREAKQVVEEVKQELKEKNINFDHDIKLGAMIELPSAALTSDIISREADFLSIGTNDLIQYTLAVDRMNENVADMYEPMHLSILRLLKQIIDGAHKNGKAVAMCGEIASDVSFTKILLGLGLDEFSIPPVLVLKLKKLIRNLSFSESKNFAERIVNAKDDIEVKKLLLES